MLLYRNNTQFKNFSHPRRRPAPPGTRDDALRPFAWEANYTTSLHVGEEVFDCKVFLCRRGQDSKIRTPSFTMAVAKTNLEAKFVRRALEKDGGKSGARERGGRARGSLPSALIELPSSQFPSFLSNACQAGYRHPELTRPHSSL